MLAILCVVMFVAVGCLIYFWETCRFGGLFYRRHFKQDMFIEVWHYVDNGYGVKQAWMKAEYRIMEVNLNKGNLTLIKANGWNSPVSFLWLFNNVFNEDGYMILKDAEGNVVKKIK